MVSTEKQLAVSLRSWCSGPTCIAMLTLNINEYQWSLLGKNGDDVDCKECTLRYRLEYTV